MLDIVKNPNAVIALIVIAWTAGLFVGMFTARFTSKKQCDLHRAELWKNLDALQSAMMGKPITFKLTLDKD